MPFLWCTAQHCTLDSFATLMNMDGYLLLSNDPF